MIDQELLKRIERIDDETVRDKKKILEALYSDSGILISLNNKELLDNEAEGDEYVDNNIYGSMIIPTIESEVKNFICFEVENMGEIQGNKAHKIKQVTFQIIVHEKDLKTEYGISRVDLISLLIKDIFNWSNMLGLQIRLLFDNYDTLSGGYYCRKLKFQSITPNGLNRGQMANFYGE